MSAFQKLRSKLSELFQLDAAAELDFGIYRILNARRVEISEFLDSLEGQVDRILAEAMDSGAGEARAELAKAEADLRAMGLNDDAVAAVPKIRELRGKIATGTSDPTARSHEIFSHLATFFSRYYQDGDFISLRRYKKDTYAIPYEGEEVKLHWANADQYYIKSSETLRDYSFRLGPAPKGDKPDTRPTVTFKLVEADIEKDNAKAVAGQERRFVFQGVVDSDTKDHLVLGFAYLPLGKAEKQAALNEAAAKAILTEHAKGAFTELAAKDPTYTGSQKGGRTILAKHLTEYTGRNTFDYFVHKDLGGFLRRELDFYIKNEVLHLDDLDEAPEANWNEIRAKLKALRTIAAKVIRFLAQLEDFQKKLWLKKKFVTACDYVVTLDRIPEELYPEIAACDAQREEWVRLFAIDEIEADLGRTGYSAPLTVDFLKENQTLPIDTSLFQNQILKAELIVKAKQSIGGVAVHGEASSFLRLSKNTLSQRLDAALLDPPYNTGSDGFAYKDEYRHSTWQSMMRDRLVDLRNLMKKSAFIAVMIDDNEFSSLTRIMEEIFGEANRAAYAPWRSEPIGGKGKSGLRIGHEYVVTYHNGDASGISFDERSTGELDRKDKFGKYRKGRELRKWGDSSLRIDREEMWYGLKAPDGTIVYPVRNDGKEGRWRWGKKNPGIIAALEDPEVLHWEKVTFDKGVVIDGQIERWVPFEKIRDEKKSLGWSTWLDEHGTSADGTRNLKDLFLEKPTGTTPKPLSLLEWLGTLCSENSGIHLDCFAGSGTTGHAVINLNREDGGDRKYILIEMGEHFDTVLVPRLKKVIYSSDWKDGKPQSRNTGVSHCFKILRLESYEETLNNLRLSRTRAQELALEAMPPEAREDYRLGYMLDLEASGSQSLLNVSAFTDPWNYTMEIATGTAGETKTTKVDLVETFNWLLGLTVLAQGHGGGVQWVEGTNPEGDKVLVLWRNTTEVDADALNDWCKKQKISVLDGEFDLIYVNGDHHLENLRREDQTWKVRLTDEEFPKLMWEGRE
jgi:adenine-specific DNA-methyltransferase